MEVVAYLSLSRSCVLGLAGGSSLIRSSRSLKPSCVMIAFLQLGKLGPVSFGMLVRSRPSPMIEVGRGDVQVSCCEITSVEFEEVNES